MRFCVNCGCERIESDRIVAPVGRLMPVETFFCSPCEIAGNYTPLFFCVLTDKVVPKARPRVTKWGTYMPKNYTEWRQVATAEIELAIYHHSTNITPLELPFDRSNPVAVVADFYGSCRVSADLDNLIGAILDVLADGEWALTDDDVLRVPILSVQYHPLPKSTKRIPQNPRTELRIYAL